MEDHGQTYTMRIFIGYDDRIPMASDVLEYTLRKHSSIPLDIKLLKIKELGLNREDPLASTQFTFSRFLVPYLCNYDGLALFLDNDMVCMSDIKEIFDLDMSNYALRVVKHNHIPTVEVKMDGKIQTSYPRKNWSSMMLMNCAKLKCWTREAIETMSPSWLHRFEPIQDAQIGGLPPNWNVLDEDVDNNTKLWHMTTGAPYFDKYADMPNALIWYKAFYDMIYKR